MAKNVTKMVLNKIIDKKPDKSTSTSGEEGCVVCFSALGIGSRMKIYRYLKEHGESTVSSIVGHIKLTQPTVSYHLNEMRNAGLLKSTRLGKSVYYMLDTECKIFHRDCVLKGVQFPSN